MKDLQLRARVVVGTSNMNILRHHLADVYVKKSHQKACRTCKAIVFSHSTNQIIDLGRCLRGCRRHLLSSPMTTATATRVSRICIFNEEKR